MDEAMTNLSNSGREWFQKLGSKNISNLQYRGAFVFMSIPGEVCFEKASQGASDSVSIT